MIPILYEKDETAFTSNGFGRLRDCISCVVTEERNGIYECDFEYPVDGVNYDRIQCGRIIAVEHDESNDVQPFDIVGYSRPINGVVTFHAVHISYRQTAMTVSGTNINSLSSAFTMLGNAVPSNPFNYWTDKSSTGYLASGDGIPHSVRSILGGMEGSILDAYGGEYEWDTWTVKLWASRGSLKNFTIRYGVNLTDYSEDTDYTDTYTSVIPYWVGQDADGNDTIIKGDKQTSGYPSFNGMERCIPLDVTDKFDSEDGQPTQAQVEAQGMAYINANQPYLPSQTIKVDFLRISDSPEYAQFANLQKCKLCDSIKVIFPRYNVEGTFKIVKTEYDVLREKYNTLELGTLSISLATALGINSSGSYYVSVGGGGGTTDYTDLSNKPQINGNTLSGNKTTSQLGIHDVPSGGTTDQVLAKNSNTDYDLKWTTPTGSGTDVPTADTVAEFDSSAHMNSTDMTSAQVDDFVDGLNFTGSGFNLPLTSVSSKMTRFTNVSGGYYKCGNLVIVQVHCYVNETFSANDYWTALGTFPSPATTNIPLTVSFSADARASGASAVINTSGDMKIQSGAIALTNYTLYINGVYICTT